MDSPASLEYRFRGKSSNMFKYLTDYILISNEDIKFKLLKLGVPTRRILLCKHPYYDFIIKKKLFFSKIERSQKIYSLFNLKQDKSNKKKVLVFLTELSKGLEENEFVKNDDYELVGKKNSYLRTHVILDEVIDSIKYFRNKIHFVLRLHPKENFNDYQKYFSSVDSLSKFDDSLEIIYFSDIIIGLTTNLLTEAAIMNKPVLSVTPRFKEFSWLSNPVKPSILHTSKKKELKKIIKLFLNNYYSAEYRRKDEQYKSITDIF